MFVNANANQANRQKFNCELGGLSRAQVILSEFKYHRGAEIFGEVEPAEYVYQVIEGAVRSYKLLSDGRRQIGAFHLVGDIFGLENGPTHRFTAEAIVETTVRLAKRVSLEHVAETDALVARDLLSAAGVMALPMNRRDIADYVGLTLETVSRALSCLHGKGILGFLGQAHRQIVLLDRPGLAKFDL